MTKKNDPITHSLCSLAGLSRSLSGQAMHSGSFAPAFTLLFHDSELKISEANALANRMCA